MARAATNTSLLHNKTVSLGLLRERLPINHGCPYRTSTISKSLLTCFSLLFNTNVVDYGKSLLYIQNIKYIYICEKEMIYSLCLEVCFV